MKLLEIIKKKINILKLLSFLKWFFISLPINLEFMQIVHAFINEHDFLEILIIVAIISWMLVLVTMFFIKRYRTIISALLSIKNSVELGMKLDEDKLERFNITKEMYAEIWDDWTKSSKHEMNYRLLVRDKKINTDNIDKLGDKKKNMFTMFLPRLTLVKRTLIIQTCIMVGIIISIIILGKFGSHPGWDGLDDEAVYEKTIELLLRTLPLLFILGEAIIDSIAYYMKIKRLHNLIVSKFHKEYNIDRMMNKISLAQQGMNWSFIIYALLYKIYTRGVDKEFGTKQGKIILNKKAKAKKTKDDKKN